MKYMKNLLRVVELLRSDQLVAVNGSPGEQTYTLKGPILTRDYEQGEILAGVAGGKDKLYEVMRDVGDAIGYVEQEGVVVKCPEEFVIYAIKTMVTYTMEDDTVVFDRGGKHSIRLAIPAIRDVVSETPKLQLETAVLALAVMTQGAVDVMGSGTSKVRATVREYVADEFEVYLTGLKAADTVKECETLGKELLAKRLLSNMLSAYDKRMEFNRNGR